MDDIEVQGVSAQMQQSVIQGDQDKILQHEDEVDTEAKVVSVQMLKTVLEGDEEKVLLQGVQGASKRMSRHERDGVQCVQGQRKGSVVKFVIKTIVENRVFNAMS